MLILEIEKKHLKLIIENPYNEQHYLSKYWCIKPKYIDYDRTKKGDYFKKPTQYWFINIDPKCNLVFEGIDIKKKKTIWGRYLSKPSASISLPRSIAIVRFLSFPFISALVCRFRHSCCPSVLVCRSELSCFAAQSFTATRNLALRARVLRLISSSSGPIGLRLTASSGASTFP